MDFSVNLFARYEQRVLDAAMAPAKRDLPVTLLTGFLGAGKTTLLRHIVGNKQNLRVAAAVNDFAKFNMDSELLESTPHSVLMRAGKKPRADEVLRLANGSIVASLSDQFESAIWGLLNQPENGGMDYLVIECSGVTDPVDIIELVERKYGKMTRARLDSVVCVVDTDSLFQMLASRTASAAEPAAGDSNTHQPHDTCGSHHHHQHDHSHGATAAHCCDEKHTAGHQHSDSEHTHDHCGSSNCAHADADRSEPTGFSELLKAQILSADVVLLNKLDLVRDESAIAAVEQFIHALNPSARVLRCSFSQVALGSVLEVQEAGKLEGTLNVVSHERTQASLVVIPSNQDRKLRAGKAAQPRAAVAPIGLAPFTFESSTPMHLARFQDWVAAGLDKAIIRGKGWLWFAEDRLTRAEFHFSGRGRCSIDNYQRWEGPPFVRLIFMTTANFDGDKMTQILNSLCQLTAATGSVPTPLPAVPAAGSSSVASELQQLVEADGCFQLVHHTTATPSTPTAVGTNPNHSLVIYFRLHGSRRFKITEYDMKYRFSIDLDDLNMRLLHRINYSGKLAVTYIELGTRLRNSSLLPNDANATERFSVTSDATPVTAATSAGGEAKLASNEAAANNQAATNLTDGIILRWAVSEAGTASTLAAWTLIARMVTTYTGKLPDGYITKGGYALYNRTDAHFVFPIPESLDSAETAPILCAGITVYTPLKNYGVKQGTKVAVIGIGGLGHLALQFARAMGADVTAISSSPNKEAEAKSFGAHHFIYSGDKDQFAAAKHSFHLVLNTTSGKVDFAEYIQLVANRGTWVQLGAGADIAVPTFPLLFGGVSIAGSLIGPPAYINEMLALCAKHKIKAAIEKVPWDQVEVARAKVKQNTVRYRMVLEMPKLSA